MGPPSFPVSSEDCTASANELADKGSKLGEWHQQCLDSNTGQPVNTSPAIACSIVACNSLHLARDRWANAGSTEVQACYSAVAQQRETLRAATQSRQGLEALLRRLDNAAQPVKQLRADLEKSLGLADLNDMKSQVDAQR